MGGVGDAGHVLEIVVAAGQVDGGHAVTLTEDLPDTALNVREDGRVVIDVAALAACATPRAYGRALGEMLLVGSTLTAWQRARARGRERLHVVLEVLAPALRGVRWERLAAPFEGGWEFVRCDQRTPFTLRVASQSDRGYAPPREPRALVVVTSPSDLADYGLAAFDTLATLEGVRAALAPWPVDVLAFGVPGAVGPPTLEGLCDQLTAHAYAVVHVVCHGATMKAGGETVLYLADDDETTAPVPASKLLRRLGRLGGDVGLPLVWFLAACESAAAEAEGALGGLAARLCRELGAPAVVAMSDRISIDTAGELVRPFYRQLRAHGHVDLALAEACSAVAERADLVVPVLYARAAGVATLPPTGPSGQVLADMSEPPSVTVFSESPLPLALGERCVGRAGLLAELRARLVASPDRPPALALVAPGGLGKTRVALELLWQQRALFPGGVFWLDVSAPERVEAVQHALLRRLRPGAPSLAALQRTGSVAAELAEAARGHRPGQAQLWVLDHLPEAAAGTAGPSLATLCPRLGEVAVVATSRMRPDDEGLEVIEVEALEDADGAALLMAGLPAGSLSASDAALVVRWVGGMPLALELLARSLDLGDLSPDELVVQARTGGALRTLSETQQVLRTVGAGAGLSPLVDSLRLSYDRLSPEAQALARRVAQFGPSPLPNALVKALGPVASRLARATLAARSFVTGISGQRFGAMHRVLADFLRGLCGPEEPADACAALIGLLPLGDVGDPSRWPGFSEIAVHGEALVLRDSVVASPALVDVGNAVGLLYLQQTRIVEAARIQRRTLALAGPIAAPDEQRHIIAVNNLAMTLSAQGEPLEASQLQIGLTAAVAARRGMDDPLVLLLQNNVAVTLQGLGQLQVSHDMFADVVTRRLRLGPPDEPNLLHAQSSMASAKLALGDLAGAEQLHTHVYRTWLRKLGPDAAPTLMAARELARVLHAQARHAQARALLVPVLAAARALWGPDNLELLELRELWATLLGDEGAWVEARREQAEIVVAMTKLVGPDHPRTLHAVGMLGRALSEQGAHAEARALQLPVLERLRRRHATSGELARTLVDNLCDGHESEQAHAAARDLLMGVLAELRVDLGPEHDAVLRCEVRLAQNLGRLGEIAAARVLLVRVHAILAARLGPRHAQTLAVVDRLATLELWGADLPACRALRQQVLADSRVGLGSDHIDTLTRAYHLGQSLVWLGETAAGAVLLREAHAGLVRTLGADHLDTIDALAQLAYANVTEAPAEAALQLPLAIAGLAARLPADHVELLRLRIGVARLDQREGRLGEALAGMTAVLPALVRAHGAVFTEAAFAAMTLALALHVAGRGAEALPLLRRGLVMATAVAGPGHPSVIGHRLNLAMMLVRAAGDVAGAARVLDEVDADIARSGGAEHPLAATAANHRAQLLRRV